MLHTADVPLYPMPRDTARCPFDPAGDLAEIQQEEGLRRVRIWDGSEPWLVTRHTDIRAVMASPLVSADTDNPAYPHSSAAIKARRARAKTFFTEDGPAHDEPRRALARDFTAKRMQSMRDVVQAVTDRCIDEMLAGPKPVDLVESLALPVPSVMICELLGVPYSEHDRFQELTKVFTAATSTPADTVAAAEEMLAMIGNVIDAKIEKPTDDTLSRLVVEQLNPGLMTREEVARMGLLLLTAGHETSANMIALGTAALLTNPEQAALIRDADDPAVAAGAVEELLRYLTIVHSGARRVAIGDFEVAGTQIRAGDGLILDFPSANRDKAAFASEGHAEPDVLDITRPARHHLAFSFGVHQCLGQQLARVELQVVYSTLLKRIPTLALAEPVTELQYKTDMSIYGLHRLPVTW
ncbi:MULTISPECIES: cytochrome P450 [Rhodococcus]|uniref:Cytochrome P450 n=1 Tax=Rhodococcus aetherivorans TaxID=191292 RepID=A0AA46PH35_9NOCA|nr:MULTISPECIES: cytochrome P450 [Rhodococcus]ANZ27152.1 cytochrome [Rhodococcus sp. WB1]MBC2592246.1 cytochrome P450 [Rhodococcus aetherivorans]QIX48494.1 cytochrome P450 [Rhodococcus sp. DMU1]UGQ40947.1 cytochrome P450 [Rhodococcus aetherivorans]USC15775.1 cytochrome P450 [Rhodococcus sp. 11-3]